MDRIVETPFGAFSGAAGEGTTRYLGVPFAKAPVGALRFRDPQLPARHAGVYRAEGYQKDPVQRNLSYDLSHYSEDCLYLNIWVPEGGDEKLPVMVWIPGGAFAVGGAGAPEPDGPCMYDCEGIARDTGCIVVSVSYRLNVFGFLNLGAYSARFDDNLGMKDVLTALRFIQRAIASFGGDPDNVTLFAESAGASVVSALLLMPDAETLFHKAIMESNCFGSFYTPEEEDEIARLYLSYVGLDETSAEGLLDLGYDALLDAVAKLDLYVQKHYFLRCSFCPVIDGSFITDFPTLAAYPTMHKPVLVGSNRSEGNFQVWAYHWQEAQIGGMSRDLFRRLSEQKRGELLAAYPELPSKRALGSALTDTMYTVPKLRFAEHLSRTGRVYVYRYDYATPVMRSLGLDACHVAELLALFELRTPPYGMLAAGSEAALRKIGGRMRAYWGAFARTGDPGTAGLLPWPPYDESTRYTLLFDETDSIASDPEKDVRLIYEGVERILI